MNEDFHPVIYNGRGYYGIKEFNGHVIYLFTEPTFRGTFLTTVPFSLASYREKHPTKAKCTLDTSKEDWTIFNLRDDWGGSRQIKIHSSLQEHIDIAIKYLKKEKLL